MTEAYQLLLAPPGNLLDRSEAFETVAGNGRGLNNLQLDCPTRPTKPDECIGRLRLISVIFDGSAYEPYDPQRTWISSGIRNTDIEFSQFKSVTMMSMEFDSVRFFATDFVDCQMELTSFPKSTLSGHFRRCDIAYSSFAGADLTDARFEDTDITVVEVSGATLCRATTSNCMPGLTQKQAQGFWYRAENPPLGMDLLPPEKRPAFVCVGLPADEKWAFQEPCLPPVTVPRPPKPKAT